MQDTTIQESIDKYLEMKSRKLKPITINSYSKAFTMFKNTLLRLGINTQISKVALVSEEWIKYFIVDLKQYAPITVNVYVSPIKLWFRFLSENYDASINFTNLRKILGDLLPKSKSIKPTEPNFNDISCLIIFMMDVNNLNKLSGLQRLRFLRDCAIILTLADTGIDSATVCSLCLRDLNPGKKVIYINERRYGKSSVEISRRALQAISTYHKERVLFNQNFGKNVTSVPIFCRHTNGMSEKIGCLVTRTILRIVEIRAKDALGGNYHSDITPIWFRQYYERTINQSNEIFINQKILQRCYDLFQNGQYEDAVFNSMKVVEEEVRKKAGASNSDIGADLINSTMTGNSPKIKFSLHKGEQESACALFRGAIGFFKNPSSHRFNDNNDQIKTFQCLAYASLLLNLLDDAMVSTG